jgi:hypothetical protein
MPKCPQCGRDTRPGYRRCRCGVMLHTTPDGTVSARGGRLTREAICILGQIPGLMAARWVSDQRSSAEEESADSNG